MNLITNSLKYKKDQKYICWDVETEHLNLLTSNRPWQLGMLVCQGTEILESHNIYIKWSDLNVSAGAAIVTGYDQFVVQREGKDPREVLEWFDSYLYDETYRIIFFNGLNFDYAIHNIWRRELGFETDYSYIDRCIDVHALVKAIKLNFTFSPNNFLFDQYKLLNYHQRGLKTNLAQSCKDFGVKVDEGRFHSASYDIVQTFLVFWETLKKLEIK